MIAVLSPAKSLDESKDFPNKDLGQPKFIEEAEYLVGKLKKKKPRQLQNLMGISEDLAQTNYERFQAWNAPFDKNNAFPSLFLFKGDVYQGLDARSLKSKDLEFAENHIRILSGLYGVLKPMDLIQPYRLEMGTPFKVTAAKRNLYDYWGDKLRKSVEEEVENSRSPYLINLASNEYFKALQRKKLDVDVIDIDFKEIKDGKPKTIPFFAKKARGLMARFMIQNRIDKPEDLQAFDLEKYSFDPNLSSEKKLVFTR